MKCEVIKTYEKKYIVEFLKSCCSEKFYQEFDVLDDALEFVNKKIDEDFYVIFKNNNYSQMIIMYRSFVYVWRKKTYYC